MNVLFTSGLGLKDSGEILNSFFVSAYKVVLRAR